MDLVAGPEARRAFDLEHEPVALRDRYGRHPLGQNLLLARRLIEAGVRLVSVTAWTGTPPGEKFRNVQTWDMHGEGAGLGSIFGTGAFGLGWALPNLDQAVSALLEDLHVRGRLDSTLVVMVGEFGRSPKIVKAGRDHWPACYSALLAGAGVCGGMVYGASDAQGGYVRDGPVSPERFGATLFHALGVRPETRLGADGFTVERPEGGHPTAPAVAVRFRSGRSGRTLQFNGHLDTVHLPFVPPHVEQERIMGSGAADMKAGLAAAVEALRVLRETDALTA